MKRYMPQHADKRKHIPSDRMIAISICLITAIATLSVGITLAKTVSTASGSDSTQGAAFIVETDGPTNNSLSIDCNTSIHTTSYAFSVTNQKSEKVSEVSMKYDVSIILPQALPNGVTMTVNGKNASVSTDKKTYTFSDMGRFHAGQGKTDSHTLTFSVANADAVWQDYQFTNTSILVRAEQVD